jgi:hypothetical protein
VTDKVKFARRSFGEPYRCQQAWPDDCFVQCGGNGIVINAHSRNPEEMLDNVMSPPEGSYRTAFFEAFPTMKIVERRRLDQVFIRGEGKTIEDAEEKCWQKYQTRLSCPKHEFERRGRVDGYGFCKHCRLSASDVLPYLSKCEHCDAKGFSHFRGKWYCEKHFLETEKGKAYRAYMDALEGLYLGDIPDGLFEKYHSYDTKEEYDAIEVTNKALLEQEQLNERSV